MDAFARIEQEREHFRRIVERQSEILLPFWEAVREAILEADRESIVESIPWAD